MKKNHQLKLEALKQLADSMDKEREIAWKKRAKSANEMNTFVKTMQMKNLHKAESRNERKNEKLKLQNNENSELSKLFNDQRDKHKKEDDEISELSRHQD